VLACFLLQVVARGYPCCRESALSDQQSVTTPSSPECNAATGSNAASARLLELLKRRPELAALLKSYLFQRLQTERVEISQNSVTDQMVMTRIQSDPVFARDASQWLLELASQASASLQPQPTDAKPGDTSASSATTSSDQTPSQAALVPTLPHHRDSSQQTQAVASPLPVPDGALKASASPVDLLSARQAEPAGGVSPASKKSASAYSEQPDLGVGALPRNLLQDQMAFWTQPFRFKVQSLSFLVPAAFGTAVLIGSDTAIEQHLPKSSNTVKNAANASTAGMAALVGVGGGLFLLGEATQDAHKREAGYLAGEAAIDAYAASTAMQYMTQRERPFTGNGKGQFFYGGTSFPSNTAAVSWAAASVIAHEYPGTLTKLFAYGIAAGVSAGRVIGEKHWTSDAVIGSALGWYMGTQIYKARSQGPEISAANWGTFEAEPREQGYNPAYMGSTYVPLDSWVYPAFERIAAMGFLPTAITAIRPWPRLECARLVQEAEEQLRSAAEKNTSVRAVVASLQQEFAMELANLEGARNSGVQLESTYTRATEIGGMPLRDSYDFAQTIYDDYGRAYGQGFNAIAGASGRAEAGPLAFYLRGEFQRSAAIANYTPAQAQAIANGNLSPTLPLSSVPTFNSASKFRPIEAYVALNFSNWQLSFGWQTYYWGPDRGSSLMFSNNAPSEPMLKFGRVVPYQLPEPFAWLGKIRNTVFVGALTDYHWGRGAYPEFPVYGSPYQNLNPRPYTWGDKLGLKMTENFEVGVALSVIWAGPGRPATLHTWLHTFNTNGNFQAVDPGKRYTGINCSYRLPKLRDWVTFYIDGMANDEPNPIAYPQDSAFNLGLYFARLPKLSQMDLRVEGIYTNVPGYPGLGPYYANERYAQGYTNYWQIIGSWVGRQGDGIQAWSTYWFSPRNKIQLGYRRQYVDPVYLRGGGLNDFSTSVDWLFKRDIQLSSTVQYERWNFPLLSAVPKNNVSASFQIMFWPTHGTTTGKYDWIGH
jgi:membrane-associated phospholipid phosphatase